MANLSSKLRAIVGFCAVPWGAFVAAFLFYVGVTLAAISGAQLADTLMAVLYLLPLAAYLLVLLARALQALSAVTVRIGHFAAPRLQ